MNNRLLFHHKDNVRRGQLTGCPAWVQWARADSSSSAASFTMQPLAKLPPGSSTGATEASKGTSNAELQISEISECLISQKIEEPDKNLVSQG